MEGMTCIKMGMIHVVRVLREAASVSSVLFLLLKEHGGGVVGTVRFAPCN
jgi:hypothetical protein